MSFRNVYVKSYKKFPYSKLTGRDILEYYGKIIFYENSLPCGYSAKEDMVFDCDCEFGDWRELKKIFRTKKKFK